MRALSIPVTTHGRVLVEDAADVVSGAGALVAFHGYGQAAEDMLAEVGQIPGASGWTRVSVQGLHRFYARDNLRVIASWMTRQDREAAIADNVGYVDRVIAELGGHTNALGPSASRAAGLGPPLVFIGFSQGVAMAYRAAVLGAHEPSGVIALAGDFPPDLRADGVRRPCPRTLAATGLRDTWFTPARLEDDAAYLRSRGVEVDTLTFDGGHEWTDEFRAAAGRWLIDVRGAD